jgi:hypothetical protein
LVANTNLICAGDPVDIIASGATTYTWDNGANTASINVSPSITTIYTLTGETNNCSTTETISISVFIPTLAISGNTSICNGETATLTASSANSYAWNNGFTSAVIQVNPLTTTVYSLTALTTSAGINCPSYSSFQVVVKPTPILTAIASRTNMCKNENNTITVSGASSYSWNTGATTASILITPSLVTTINYSVLGTSSINCSSSTVIAVKVNACTGLSNLTEMNDLLTIYPNPNSGEFKIKSDQALELKLINEMGQLIKYISLVSDNNFEVDLSGLSVGIYFVTSVDQTIPINQKVLITQ